MSDLTSILESLSPQQRDSLAAMLLRQAAGTAAATAEPLAPVQPDSYYNMDEAVPATFKADLSVNEKSRNKTYAERFDHVWCKGNNRAKGPKGGVYFVGRCVMGVKKGQQVKGTLRVGSKYFDALQSGGEMDAWFRPDGESESVLIGTLSNYRAV